MTDTEAVRATSTDARDEMSFCRQCGGERHHIVLYEKTISWSEDDPSINGADTWSVLQCAGCHTITFIHSHWFSEDYKIGNEGEKPIVHYDFYPPSFRRKPPEWLRELVLFLKGDEFWIAKLLEDIYSAAGMQARSLAAMGARAIVDHLVTSRAVDQGSFLEKLKKLESQSVITTAQVGIINAAFDAGSAAAHRGYSPTEDDLNTLLDITESLLQQICVTPALAARQARAVEKLRAGVPKRPARPRQ